jgi:hypothetical protein
MGIGFFHILSHFVSPQGGLPVGSSTVMNRAGTDDLSVGSSFADGFLIDQKQ